MDTKYSEMDLHRAGLTPAEIAEVLGLDVRQYETGLDAADLEYLDQAGIAP
jgi:hypothetical protein